MIDERTEQLLGALCSLCDGNGYAVINTEDITTLLPNAGFDRDSIEKSLMRLSLNEYINLRFSEGDEFCLSVLKKGREYSAIPTVKTSAFARFRWLLTPISAFLGAMIGSLIIR